MDFKALKVSEVNYYLKRLVLSDMVLSNISVEGEISNFKHHYSGHMYFNLKDEKAKIKAVMFKGDNSSLNFIPEDGKKIVATGYISIYEKEGEYQLYIRHMKESGLGDLHIAFENLKRKLDEEGLFLEKHKKPIPFMPKKIGIVTSSTGAAIRDIITVIKRRFPPCELLIYPSLVQGENAPDEIIRGLKYLDNRDDIDLIITGRGGGSIEELFAFNDENLARLIFALKTPIISAVGHEVDFTIADFVADLRAATPSAAAELSVPNIADLKRELDSKFIELIKVQKNKLNINKVNLDLMNSKLKRHNPLIKLKEKRQEIDSILKELDYEHQKIISNHKNQLLKIKGKLDLLNPELALDRGYGIILNSEGKMVKSIDNLHLDDLLNIVLKDGRINTIVKAIEKEEIK